MLGSQRLPISIDLEDDDGECTKPIEAAVKGEGDVNAEACEGDDEEENECAVCLEVLQIPKRCEQTAPEDELRVLPCAHVFHAECVATLRSCPLCCADTGDLSSSGQQEVDAVGSCSSSSSSSSPRPSPSVGRSSQRVTNNLGTAPAGILGNGRKRPLASGSRSSGSQRRRRTLADFFGRPRGAAADDDDDDEDDQRSALVRPALYTGAIESSSASSSSSSSGGSGSAAAAPVTSVNSVLKWSNRAAQEAAKAKAAQEAAAAAAASMWGSDGRGASSSFSSPPSYVSPYANALAAAGLAPHTRVPDWAVASSRGDPFLERHWPPWVAARVCLSANPTPPPGLAQLLRHKPEPRSVASKAAPGNAVEGGGAGSQLLNCGEGGTNLAGCSSSSGSSSSSSSNNNIGNSGSASASEIPEPLRSEVEQVPAIVWWVGGCRRVDDNPPFALARWLAWRLALPLVAVACVHPSTMEDAARSATCGGVPPFQTNAVANAALEPGGSGASVSDDSGGGVAARDASLESPGNAAHNASVPPALQNHDRIHKVSDSAPNLFEGRGAALYASALVNTLTTIKRANCLLSSPNSVV